MNEILTLEGRRRAKWRRDDSPEAETLSCGEHTVTQSKLSAILDWECSAEEVIIFEHSCLPANNVGDCRFRRMYPEQLLRDGVEGTRDGMHEIEETDSRQDGTGKESEREKN